MQNSLPKKELGFGVQVIYEGWSDIDTRSYKKIYTRF